MTYSTPNSTPRNYREGGLMKCSDPNEHCPRDVIRPPKNWKTPPLLDIHKHPPPPLDIVRVTSSTFQGGGLIGPGHAHFA